MDLDEILGVGSGKGDRVINTNDTKSRIPLGVITETIIKMNNGKEETCHKVHCRLPIGTKRRYASKTEDYFKIWFVRDYVFYDKKDMQLFCDENYAKRPYFRCRVSFGMALVKFNLMDVNKREQFIIPSGTTDAMFDISYIKSVLTQEDKEEINKMIELLEDGMPTAEPNKRDDMNRALQMLREIMSDSPKSGNGSYTKNW